MATSTSIAVYGSVPTSSEVTVLPNGDIRRRNTVSVNGRSVYTTLAVQKTISVSVSGGKAYAMAVKSVLEAEIQEYFRKASTISITA